MPHILVYIIMEGNKIMSKWDFVVNELKALQSGVTDNEASMEHYVQDVLLQGYTIKQGVQYNSKGTV